MRVFDNADVWDILAASATSPLADGTGGVRAAGDVLTVVTTRVSDHGHGPSRRLDSAAHPPQLRNWR